ncbi:hypothetical protein FSP39_019797 [Pinctada imbricata]|uniref:NADAR domain-containing protein n=1 Tax=Pinctada imbricata TaxID=66713 RepID=A0AA88XC59_PINIB|nr:hypothetical protein FSP39_019797 [Pinctada imbricata]
MTLYWNKHRFHSVEQAFQYEKALRHGEKSLASKIDQSRHAGIAKKLGRQVKLDPRWDIEKERLMYNLLRTKSRQCGEFREKLIESGENQLLENKPDPYWGIGKDGKGMNVLGKMMVELRSELLQRMEKEKSKPKAVVIGSSLVKNMRGDWLSSRVSTDVHIAYTIPAAKEKMQDIPCDTNVVLFQLLSNDVKKMSESKCVEDLENLVKLTKEKCRSARIIISLPPNRGDSRSLNTKTDVVNAHVKSLFAEDNIVSICDNSNLSYRGEPNRRFICGDGVHPTPEGEKVLFANIRRAIEGVL